MRFPMISAYVTHGVRRTGFTSWTGITTAPSLLDLATIRFQLCRFLERQWSGVDLDSRAAARVACCSAWFGLERQPIPYK